MEDYKKHLECCIEYWKMIATAEKREDKSIELQEIIKDIENRILFCSVYIWLYCWLIIKDIENRIHNLEGDKRWIYRIISRNALNVDNIR